MSDFVNGGSDLTDLSECDIYRLKNRFDYIKWCKTTKEIRKLINKTKRGELFK